MPQCDKKGAILLELNAEDRVLKNCSDRLKAEKTSVAALDTVLRMTDHAIHVLSFLPRVRL